MVEMVRYRCSEPIPKRCEKTFHAFPGDVGHCPYCGGAVECLTLTNPTDTDTKPAESVGDGNE